MPRWQLCIETLKTLCVPGFRRTGHDGAVPARAQAGRPVPGGTVGRRHAGGAAHSARPRRTGARGRRLPAHLPARAGRYPPCTFLRVVCYGSLYQACSACPCSCGDTAHGAKQVRTAPCRVGMLADVGSRCCFLDSDDPCSREAPLCAFW